MGLRLRAELRASRDALCVVLARMWVGAVVLLTGRVAGVGTRRLSRDSRAAIANVVLGQ